LNAEVISFSNPQNLQKEFISLQKIEGAHFFDKLHHIRSCNVTDFGGLKEQFLRWGIMWVDASREMFFFWEKMWRMSFEVIPEILRIGQVNWFGQGTRYFYDFQALGKKRLLEVEEMNSPAKNSEEMDRGVAFQVKGEIWGELSKILTVFFYFSRIRTVFFLGSSFFTLLDKCKLEFDPTKSKSSPNLNDRDAEREWIKFMQFVVKTDFKRSVWMRTRRKGKFSVKKHFADFSKLRTGKTFTPILAAAPNAVGPKSYLLKQIRDCQKLLSEL